MTDLLLSSTWFGFLLSTGTFFLAKAVNRRCGRSDYLPCICWGRRAREYSALGVGSRLALEGRIQSRPYIKIIDGESVEKVAFEVSASRLSRLDG